MARQISIETTETTSLAKAMVDALNNTPGVKSAMRLIDLGIGRSQHLIVIVTDEGHVYKAKVSFLVNNETE